jgi:hypothetical protein
LPDQLSIFGGGGTINVQDTVTERGFRAEDDFRKVPTPRSSGQPLNSIEEFGENRRAKKQITGALCIDPCPNVGIRRRPHPF